VEGRGHTGGYTLGENALEWGAHWPRCGAHRSALQPLGSAPCGVPEPRQAVPQPQRLQPLGVEGGEGLEEVSWQPCRARNWGVGPAGWAGAAELAAALLASAGEARGVTEAICQLEGEGRTTEDAGEDAGESGASWPVPGACARLAMRVSVGERVSPGVDMRGCVRGRGLAACQAHH